MDLVKIELSEKEMPTRWYNVLSDMRVPMSPPLHPGTLQPLGPADLAPLFPMALIMQEVSQDRYIDIPEELQQIYRMWRPSPLFRAPLFPMDLIMQEFIPESYIEIPDEVQEIYRTWRPTVLHRAHLWRRPWIPPPKYTTSTRVEARRGATSSTQRWPRLSTTSRRG